MSLTAEIQDLRRKFRNLLLSIQTVSFESLFSNGDIGNSAGQLAEGNHTHPEFAMTTTLSNVEGGAANTLYTVTQNVDGGSATSTYNMIIDGGNV